MKPGKAQEKDGETMNKNVLKTFAINARLELLARVRDRATFYGITDEKVKNNQIFASKVFQKLDGQLLSKNEIAQRNALLQRIQNNGYVQVMEEAAYTWFNRFIAIKYMEVHKLLPVDQRVIPQQAGELPQLVREAQNVTLENTCSQQSRWTVFCKTEMQKCRKSLPG